MRVNRELAGTYSRVKDWAKRFREGRAIERVSKMMKNSSNLVITPHIIDTVRNITGDDPHSTVAEIAHHLDISTGSVDDILLNHLEYRKFLPDGRRTSHTITQEQKSTRVSCAQELLKMYEQANSRRLGEICTGDETWIMHAEPLRRIRVKLGFLKVRLLPPIPDPISREEGVVLYILRFTEDSSFHLCPQEAHCNRTILCR